MGMSTFDELPDLWPSGTLREFANVLSARTAVGATANGTVVLVHVDGKTREGGINLFQLATLLKELGVVSAINLDGGGSATLVVNNTLVSYPSDVCNLFTCERPVSTVLCVRARCPAKCPDRSRCIGGFCVQTSDWQYYYYRYKHWRQAFVATVILAVLVSMALVSLVIAWLVVRHNKVEQQRMKVLHLIQDNVNNDNGRDDDDDDFIHFDSRPLMLSVDYNDEL